MYVVVIKFGNQNYTLNRHLNVLKYYLLKYTKPCSNIDEYDAAMSLHTINDLIEDDPHRPV